MIYMAVGDVTLQLGAIAAGASVQVQVATRCKVIGGFKGGAAYSILALSSDGTTYYNIGGVGYQVLGSPASGQTTNYIFLPSGIYIQISNTDTNPHGYALMIIEY